MRLASLLVLISLAASPSTALPGQSTVQQLLKNSGNANELVEGKKSQAARAAGVPKTDTHTSDFKFGASLRDEHVQKYILNEGDFLAAVNPPLQDDEVIEVVVLRAFLQMIKKQPPHIRKVVELTNLNHGGLGFIRKSSGLSKDQLGGALELQIHTEKDFLASLVPQFRDQEGGVVERETKKQEGSIFPAIPKEGEPAASPEKVKGGSLVWDNEIVVSVANRFDVEYWDEITPVGTISGRELKQIDCWLANWRKSLRYYQLLSVHKMHDTHPLVKDGKLDASVETTTLLEGHTCFDFVYDLMAYVKGIQHTESTWDIEKAATVKKSNTKVLTDTAMTPLKWDEISEEKRQQIIDFYNLSFAHLIPDPLNAAKERYAYVYDKNTDTYWEVKQAPPLYAYSWESVDWSLHTPMLFSGVCGAPEYETKFISPFDSVGEFVRVQTQNKERARREKEEKNKKE
eukprot:GDKI01035532.1.p1 GENE.GDKI01035532.1~~GDKI01035532.1.p1  ORF type:complete len:458 (+),score=188.81 GDKI01035532.1:111-1484(+)